MKQLSDKILDLMDAKDTMSRSDLQGCVDALVMEYTRKIEEINNHLHEAEALLILKVPYGIDRDFWNGCIEELEQAVDKVKLLTKECR